MTRRNEWEEFFDGHAPVYMDNSFTKNTVAEVDFVLEELGLPRGSRILDVGCGTGRHAVELARRGYWVTGVDISSGMLAEAEKVAREAIRLASHKLPVKSRFVVRETVAAASGDSAQ